MPLDLDTLKALNVRINEEIAYTPDREQYRCEDWWEDGRESKRGDCDDYAVAKVRALLEAGFDRKDVRLALCYVETGEYHAVAAARIGGGWYILDNRHPFPMTPDQLPYTWDRWGLGREWRKIVIAVG